MVCYYLVVKADKRTDPWNILVQGISDLLKKFRDIFQQRDK